MYLCGHYSLEASLHRTIPSQKAIIKLYRKPYIHTVYVQIFEECNFRGFCAIPQNFHSQNKLWLVSIGEAVNKIPIQ